MDNYTPTHQRPDRRFAFGGLLCVLLSFFLVVEIFVGIMVDVEGMVVMISEFLNGWLTLPEIIGSLFSSTEYVIVSAISAFSLFIFGFLITCQVYSKGLLFFPIFHMLISVYWILSGAFSTLGSFISFGIPEFFELLGDDFLVALGIFFRYTNPLNFVCHVLMLLFWLLTLIIIAANCSKRRAPEHKGRLRFIKYLLPPVIIAYCVTVFTNSLLSLFIGGAAVCCTSFGNAIVALFGLYVIALIVEFLFSGPWLIFLCVTAFWTASWLTRPYKKVK